MATDNHNEESNNVESQEEVLIAEGRSFAAQVDDVLSGADTTSTHLKVMNTPVLLRQAGARSLPMLMTARHLKLIVNASGSDTGNYHDIGVETVKQLPELLSDPAMIMDSKRRTDSVVLVTTALNRHSDPIIAAVKFDGTGNIDDLEVEANIITSAYGKENFNNFLQESVDLGKVIYWDKEKCQELSETPGIQFPSNLRALDSNIIIRKAIAFVNSESTKNKEEVVKTVNDEEKGIEMAIEKYQLDFRLPFSNELLLREALKQIGYQRDYSIEEENLRRSKAAVESNLPQWTNVIRFIGKEGKTIEGLYERTNNGVVLEATDIMGFTTNGLTQDEVKQVADIVRGFDVEVEMQQIQHKEMLDAETQSQQSDEAENIKEDFRHKTKQGYTVVKIEKSTRGEDIAIIQREKDFVVAFKYDVQDGTWAQGHYNFSNLEAAQSYVDEEYKSHRKATSQNLNTESAEPVENAVAQREKIDYVKKNREAVVNELIERMQNGNLTWAHFAQAALPMNGETGRKYNGANRFLLTFAIAANGWSDPRFYTIKQVNAMGLSVKKGSHGCRVELWSSYDINQKKMVERKELREQLKDLTDEEFENYCKKNIRMLSRQYTVFNGEQVEGLEKYNAPVLDESKANVACENVLSNSFCPILYDTKNEAYYAIQADEIHLPPRSKFTSLQQLYSTAFHEMAHASGHETRLKRDLSGKFGAEAYAKEELIAELTSVFMQQDLAVSLIDGKMLDNHAAYLQDWLRSCKPEDFFEAVKKADQANAFIQEKVNEKMNNSEDAKREKILKYYQEKKLRTLDNLENNVPAEMKALPQWCVFKTYSEDGKKKKVNLDVATGKWAKVNDPTTWTTFDKAIEYARQNGCEGVTFVLTENSGIKCVDLDHCIFKDADGKLTKISDAAQKIVASAKDTYAEKSTSGTGVHIFFKGDVGNLNNRIAAVPGSEPVEGSKEDVEFYSTGKFISMTGNCYALDGKKDLSTYTPDSEFASELKSRLGERKMIQQQTTQSQRNIRQSDRLSDDEVISMLRRSKSGSEFDRLWGGEDVCGDHSKSDYRLVSMLAFGCSNDSDQVKRLFVQSGLYRAEKGDKYVDRTVNKVVSSNTNVYSRRPFWRRPKSSGKPGSGSKNGK